MIKPARPRGHSPEAILMQWLWDRASALEAHLAAPGIYRCKTTRGVIHSAAPVITPLPAQQPADDGNPATP